MSHELPDKPSLIIEPPKGWALVNFSEIWQYRDFLLMAVYRDLKARYTQTVLGPLWAIIQPLILMVIYTVIFGGFIDMPTGGVPHAVFYYCALVPWTFISTGMNQSISSLHGNFTVITKIYFPRILLPVQSMAVGLLDVALSILILFGICAVYGYPPTWKAVLLPVFLIPGVLAGIAAGMFLSVLSVQFRDIRMLAPHFTMVWMYSSPIIYPRDAMYPWLRDVAALNPMATMIEGFRWCFDAGELAPMPYLLGSLGLTVGMFLIGAVAFRRLERNLIDVL